MKQHLVRDTRRKTTFMHKHFSCTESGSETFPILGASPDEKVNCACHDGLGTINTMYQRLTLF